MLEILLPNQQAAFYSGETIDVGLSWSLDSPPERVELRLLWNTVGKGDRNLSVVQHWSYEQPLETDRVTETIKLPDAPYSFSGKIVSLVWAFELIVFPSGDSARKEITIARDAREIMLHSDYLQSE